MGLDLHVFRWINGLAGQMPLLDALMRLLVNEPFVPTTMALILFWLWFDGESPEERANGQRAVIYAVLSLLVANIVVKACNLVYFRPRPFVDHEVNLLFYRPTDSSFPSNPAAVGFAFATGVWLLKRRVGLVMFVLAALFAFSRVFCGVHYPSDVLAGALIGLLSGALVGRVRRALGQVTGRLIGLARRFFLA